MRPRLSLYVFGEEGRLGRIRHEGEARHGCVEPLQGRTRNSGPNGSATRLGSPRDEPDEEATAPESLETRAAASAKTAATETVERPGLARKLSSFLFGEQEEEPTTVAEAEEAPSAEQPPPLPAETNRT